MFRVAEPKPDDLQRATEIASQLDFVGTEFLASRDGLKVNSLPAGFAHDLSRTSVSSGEAGFAAAVRGIKRWENFDLGWVSVANPAARIEVGQIVAVQVHSLGLWSLNLSHIVEVIRDANAFGFIYKTTIKHLEEGEERFLVRLDALSGEVWYELEAVFQTEGSAGAARVSRDPGFSAPICP